MKILINTRNSSQLLRVGFMLLALLFINTQLVSAQTNDYEAKRARAFELLKQNKLADAQPLIEELVKSKPDDAEVLFFAGYLTFTNAQNEKDPELRKKAGLKARDYLTRAQRLGADNVNMRNMLAGIAADGSIDLNTYSNNAEADKAMQEGEAAFAKGDFKNALEYYQKALRLQPNLYEAALYTGDIYYKSDDPQKAGEWFTKAIAINPNRETAYRYWGDSLAKEGKNKEAREQFINAFVAEPYSKLAQAGLVSWAKANNVTLAHPAINIPTDVSAKNGNTQITLDPSLFNNKKDGSASWFYYGITRAAWQVPGKDGKLSDSFAKAYPGETTYRHSSAEELDALRQVLNFLNKDINDKKVENLDPALANLKKLNDAGLLEAYILMARLDNGIFQDYKVYRNTNRDKLHRYVVEYVITGGGK